MLAVLASLSDMDPRFGANETSSVGGNKVIGKTENVEAIASGGGWWLNGDNNRYGHGEEVMKVQASTQSPTRLLLGQRR